MSQVSKFLEHVFKKWGIFTKTRLTGLQMKTINKRRAILFISYIEVTFLISQHKIQFTDASDIGFKTVNLLKTIGKFIFCYVFQTGTVRYKTMSNLIFVIYRQEQNVTYPHSLFLR